LAKGRLIHKKICLSEQIHLLPNDTARLLYTWIIPQLDIDGRFYGDAQRVGSLIFPLRSVKKQSIERYLVAMEEVGLIVRYEIEGQVYMWMPKFHIHQTLRKDRERASIIPAPPEDVVRAYKNNEYARFFCFECNEMKAQCRCEEEK